MLDDAASPRITWSGLQNPVMAAGAHRAQWKSVQC